MIAALLAGLLVLSGVAYAGPLDETRYCGIENIKRGADGRIVRSKAVIGKFRRLYPCPETGFSIGACPGWSINHTIPLACGGCDSVSNLDWMPNSIKSCREDDCRDRWELSVYCVNRAGGFQ